MYNCSGQCLRNVVCLPIDCDIVKILIGNMPLNGNLGYYNLDAIKQSQTQEAPNCHQCFELITVNKSYRGWVEMRTVAFLTILSWCIFRCSLISCCISWWAKYDLCSPSILAVATCTYWDWPMTNMLCVDLVPKYIGWVGAISWSMKAFSHLIILEAKFARSCMFAVMQDL